MPKKPPRKKIVTTRYETEPEPVIPSVPAFEEDPDEEALSGILSQFGPGDVAIKVYREGPNGQQFLYRAGADVNEESIAARCGPGKYTLKVIINGEFRKAIPIEIGSTLQDA